MKRTLIYLFFAAMSLLPLSAATAYNQVVITSSENTLTAHCAGIGNLLPQDFLSTVFDASGNPTMDRLFLFMTLPAGMTDMTIENPSPRIVLTPKDAEDPFGGGFNMTTETPQFVLSAGNDVLFAYINDGTKYVLESLPIDPTTRALDEITIADGNTIKVYMTGSISGSLSAELPERITIVMPTYLESLRQSLSDLFVMFIKSAIEEMGLHNFSFNPNCEGFISFTGGESSNLHIYSDNLEMTTKSKETDFLGSIVASKAVINLLGLESTNSEPFSDSDISSMTDEQVALLDEDQIHVLTIDQIKTIATKMSTTQCGELTIGQVLGLLDYTDILQALTADASTIGTNLYQIFQDADKAGAVGGRLNDLMDELSEQLQPIMDNPMSILAGDEGLMGAIGSIFSSFVEGTASPFAFKSNSQRIESGAFNIHIHSNGVNTITGGAEGEFKNTSEEMTGLLQLANMASNPSLSSMVNDLAIMFQAMVRFCSAPFAVRPSAKMVDKDDYSEYSYTVARLIFDDIWTDGNRTNGLLQMPVVGNNIDAPSIDLGTPNGQAIFNGGRYKFHTPVSNKKLNMFYVATMAICYREFSVTMPYISQRITYTGIGTSVGWGASSNSGSDAYRNVIINDGTFTTYSAEAWKDPSRGDYAVDAVGNGWYQHYTDLRLPYNTSVLGGTFPENTFVYRCDAAAEQGVQPVYAYIDPSDPYGEHFFTALCERKELIAYPDLTATDPAPLNANGTLQIDSDKKLILTVNTSVSSTQDVEYGTSSLTPDAEGKVYVYVTGECVVNREYTRNYVTALAPFGESKGGTVMLSMGGNTEVKSLYQDKASQPLKNAYLLYTQLGFFTYNYAGVNLGGLFRTLKEEFQIDTEEHHNFKQTGREQNESGQSYITTTDTTGVVFAEITNELEYTIENGLYMMLPVMSDTWMMFSPPFDVANVYILETTDEQPQTPRSGWTNADYNTFFQRQGEADGDMAQTLVTSVLPDIFSGRGSGVKKPLPYILDSLTNDVTRLTKLEHYNGKNMLTANYYLNLLVPDKEQEGVTYWEQQNNEVLYGKKWVNAPARSTPTFLTRRIEDPDCTDWYDCEEITIVSPYTDQDGNEQAQQWCIMKRDSIYSMYFPGGANRWYDHKYIIIEGYGPQRISGKNKHSDFASPDPSSDRFPEAGYVALQGNTTFGNADLSGIDASHPLFFPEKEVSGSYPSGSISYTFVANSDYSQRILPSSVYMVSSTNSSTRASMPLINRTLSVATDLTEEEHLPSLSDRSLTAWTEQGIYLQAFQDQHIEIYSTDGRSTWNGDVTAGTVIFIPASQGVYIIRGEENVIKVINN